MIKSTKKTRDRDQGPELKFKFVPVYGNQKSSGLKSTGSVSQQQHAARQYPRQARLRRAQKTIDSSKSDEVEEPEPKSSQNIDSFDPPPICLQNRNSPVTALGAGRLDPFDTYCMEKPTLVMHEVLDHGESFTCS